MVAFHMGDGSSLKFKHLGRGTQVGGLEVLSFVLAIPWLYDHLQSKSEVERSLSVSPYLSNLLFQIKIFKNEES